MSVETVKFSEARPFITAKENLQPVCAVQPLMGSQEYNMGIKLIFPKDEEAYRNEVYENGEKKNEGQHLTIDFDQNAYVSGFMGTIQNCLVDTLFEVGSDTNHPDRGTDLEADAMNVYISNLGNLIHNCNFAAERVKMFQNGYLGTNYITLYKTEDNLDRANSDQTKVLTEDTTQLVSPTITSYLLSPQIYKLDSVSLQAQFISSEGETVGITVDTNLLEGIKSQ